MKVAFQFAGPRLLTRIAQLRGQKTVSQFLKECLITGLVTAEKDAQKAVPVALERARSEFRRLSAADVATALKACAPRDPVCGEVSRLVGLYAPVLASQSSAVLPAGVLKLDVRCAVEQAAANLAFRALKKPRATVH